MVFVAGIDRIVRLAGQEKNRACPSAGIKNDKVFHQPSPPPLPLPLRLCIVLCFTQILEVVEHPEILAQQIKDLASNPAVVQQVTKGVLIWIFFLVPV